VSIILFVAFGLGSVLFHEHFERKERRTTSPIAVAVSHADEGARTQGKFEWRPEDVEVLDSDSDDDDDDAT
jgi:hypothetical protein